MLKISFLIAFTGLTNSLWAQDFKAFDTYEFQTEANTLQYRLLKPKTIEGKKYPLVIFLHGSVEQGTDNNARLKPIAPLFLDPKNREQFPCYVLVPQCPSEQSWTYPDWYQEPKEPLKSVVSLIDSLSNHPNIDASRVYVTGISMGGYGTWYLITRFPEKFAAAIPICSGGDTNQAEHIVGVAVWAFHGKDDDIVPVEQTRTMINALKRAGGKPRYTEYKKIRHKSWEKAYKEPNLLPWLFSQRMQLPSDN